MGSNYKKLGGYIRQIDLRNSDASLGEENLYGISVTKEFIISHANLVGVTFDSYKVVAPRQFAYIPDTSRRGDKIAISLNTFGEDIIVSSICSVFEIIDENQLLPEYLMLWFMRPEFDRYARFMSNGSAREVFDWDCMCGVELPVPTIEEQKKTILHQQILSHRIDLLKKINDNLEAQAQAYFDSLFITSKTPDCTLADISVVNPTRSLQKGTIARCFEMATLPTSGCIPIGGGLKPYNGGVRFINGDTIIARITPCLENGKAAYINVLNEGEVAFGSTEYIVFAAKEGYPSSFYYFLIRNSQFVKFALQFMNGSSGRQRVSGEELASFPLKRPNHDQLLAFDRIGNAVLEQMKHYAQEIQSLKQLQDIQAAALSR